MTDAATDEAGLIARCRDGDEQAFGELVDRFRDLVHGLVWRLARDRNEVDDLAQEVFVRVHRGLPYFRGEARLSTWIYRVAANVCQEANGRAVRRAAVPLDAAPEPGGRDRAFDELAMRDEVQKALETLPEHYRLVIAAHYLQGVQYEALAEAMGVPLGTVKTHLHRAKKMLREALTRTDR